MLFQELGKLKRGWIMTSIILMAIGILMIICPEKYVSMLIAALGYGLCITATVMALDFLSSKRSLVNSVLLTLALLLEILGVAVLFYRENVLQVLGLLFGIFLILEGVHEGFNAWIYARRAQRSGWWILMLLALLLIAAGVIILANPWWDTPHVLMKVIGTMMLFASAVSIVRVILTWPFKNI